MRRVWNDGNIAWVGESAPPYRDWQWKPSGYFVGGPNFIALSDNLWIAGGRIFANGKTDEPRTVLGSLTQNGLQPLLTLPSNGDSSYPGFVFDRGVLWVLYYSSHEGNTAIYLAKVRMG